MIRRESDASSRHQKNTHAGYCGHTIIIKEPSQLINVILVSYFMILSTPDSINWFSESMNSSVQSV